MAVAEIKKVHNRDDAGTGSAGISLPHAFADCAEIVV